MSGLEDLIAALGAAYESNWKPPPRLCGDSLTVVRQLRTHDCLEKSVVHTPRARRRRHLRLISRRLYRDGERGFRFGTFGAFADYARAIEPFLSLDPCGMSWANGH